MREDRIFADNSICSIRIIVYGVRIGIRTNRAELLEAILAVAPFGWRISTGKTVERWYAIIAGTSGLKKYGRSPHCLFEDDVLLASSKELSPVLETFERQLKMYIAEHARNRVFVHAGAVGWKGRGIIIPGRSYTGKSTLVEALVRSGATYYSDEYAVLDRNGLLHPYATPLALRDPDTKRQVKMPTEKIGAVAGVKPIPVGLVVACKYRQNSRWAPGKLSPGQAMLELIDNTIPARRRPELVLAVLGSIVSGAAAVKGVRGEAADTAASILSRLTK